MSRQHDPAELARICRQQAAVTVTRETREALLKMAEEYESRANIAKRK